MALINRKPTISAASGMPFQESETVDPSNPFGIEMDGMFIPEDAEGFGAIDEDDYSPSPFTDGVKRAGNAFMETKMVPFMVATDGNTATQVAMLLEMVRYCMENSKEVIDPRTGEAATYDIHVKVRNRSKSDFVVSIGNEPLPPLPVIGDSFMIGN